MRLSLAVVACLALTVSVASAMDLIVIDDAIAKPAGAVCLDGTSPGYYFRPGSGSGANKWVIFFMGGGWCYTREDCLARSKTILGSNKFWKPTLVPQGLMGPNPEANPDFYNFNVAYFLYCDGNSFSGNASEPDMVDGTPLYYRGHRILDILLDDLMQNHNLHAAEEVLISGCSAGGLSTYLHADYVRSKFSMGVVVKAMAGSGYFLDYPNALGVPVYEDEVKNFFVFQNASGSVNERCIQAYPEAEQWKCNMAQYTYPHVTTPFFIMNSYYDWWQMGNIVFIDVPGASTCANYGYSKCDKAQLADAQAFAANMHMEIKNSPNFLEPQNGAFLHSCWNHCAASSDDNWDGTEINGVSMRVAVANWFFDRTSENIHIGCELGPTGAQCNPTCHR